MCGFWELGETWTEVRCRFGMALVGWVDGWLGVRVDIDIGGFGFGLVLVRCGYLWE